MGQKGENAGIVFKSLKIPFKNAHLQKQGVDLSFLLPSIEVVACRVPSGCEVPQRVGAMGEGRDEVGAVTPCLPSAAVWQLVIKLSV